jgi:hypothetical protein
VRKGFTAPQGAGAVWESVSGVGVYAWFPGGEQGLQLELPRSLMELAPRLTGEVRDGWWVQASSIPTLRPASSVLKSWRLMTSRSSAPCVPASPPLTDVLQKDALTRRRNDMRALPYFSQVRSLARTRAYAQKFRIQNSCPWYVCLLRAVSRFLSPARVMSLYIFPHLIHTRIHSGVGRGSSTLSGQKQAGKREGGREEGAVERGSALTGEKPTGKRGQSQGQVQAGRQNLRYPGSARSCLPHLSPSPLPRTYPFHSLSPPPPPLSSEERVSETLSSL